MSYAKGCSMLKRYYIFFFSAMVAGLAGFFIAKNIFLDHRAAYECHGTCLKQPRDIHSFHFTGIDQKPFDNTSLYGHWTLLFFGFTHCSSMCPTTMAELNQVYQLMAKRNAQVPQVVMISIDPERDNLEQLARYVKAFNPNFYGARAAEERIHQLTQELGLAYFKTTQKSHDEQNYDIEHTGAVMLINPQGKLTAFFTAPHQAKLIVDDVDALMQGARWS